MSKEKGPQCNFCHRELGEGEKFKPHQNGEHMYVCYDCFNFIGAIVSDALPQLLRELADSAEKPLSEKLEPWSLEEVETK